MSEKSKRASDPGGSGLPSLPVKRLPSRADWQDYSQGRRLESKMAAATF